jgi:hypothetical protein
MTNRPIVIREGVVVTGRFPLLVVTLRVESKRRQRDVTFWCDRLGIALRHVQSLAPGSVEVYEAQGSAKGLARFVSFPFVQSYHLPVACRVGFRASGSGELKPAHRAPLGHVVGAIKREDQRAESASAARSAGRGDNVRRERLFN